MEGVFGAYQSRLLPLSGARIEYHGLMSSESSRNVPASVVAVAGWLLPGAGHWMLGQKGRGLTIGLTIILLYVAGLLIGGVRVIEVPGYGDHGERLGFSRQPTGGGDLRASVARRADPDSADLGAITQASLMSEIRDKPWYIAQVLVGPLNLAASWGSVIASRPDGDDQAIGARSHSRTNELGVLYTAVAGMLNLLAIIDATDRAIVKKGEER